MSSLILEIIEKCKLNTEYYSYDELSKELNIDIKEVPYFIKQFSLFEILLKIVITTMQHIFIQFI